MAKQPKDRRLTDLLNVALSTASSALSLSTRAPPPQASELIKKASEAVEEAEGILHEIMRTAEKI